MTGERRVWLELAYHQRRSVSEVQRNTPVSEFFEMQLLLEEKEWYTFNRQSYENSGIIAEIRNFREAFGKTPKAYSPKDCLIKFEKETPTPTVTQPSSYEGTQGPTQQDESEELQCKIAADAAKSKAAWLPAVGLKMPEER